MAEGSKQCKKCGRWLPHSAFNRKAASKDGMQPACRECVSAYNHELYLRDPAKARARNDSWAAANPTRIREIERRRHRRAWAERNEEMRAYHRQWYAQNQEARRQSIRESARRRRARDPGAAREYQRQWLAANPEKRAVTNRRRRARKVGATIVPFTAEQLALRLSMFPGCWMCGGLKETVDHVKPLSAGGAHCLSNFRPACWSCNSSKRETWPYPTTTRKAA